MATLVRHTESAGAKEQRPAAPPLRRKYNRREAVAGYLFIAPWLVGFLVFTLGAMAYSLYISFSYYNLAKNTTRPAGLANYQALIDDPKVALALKNTLFYAIMAVPLEGCFALLLGSLLETGAPGGGTFPALCS